MIATTKFYRHLPTLVVAWQYKAPFVTLTDDEFNNDALLPDWLEDAVCDLTILRVDGKLTVYGPPILTDVGNHHPYVEVNEGEWIVFLGEDDGFPIFEAFTNDSFLANYEEGEPGDEDIQNGTLTAIDIVVPTDPEIEDAQQSLGDFETSFGTAGGHTAKDIVNHAVSSVGAALYDGIERNAHPDSFYH